MSTPTVTTELPLAAGHWTIDPAHSSVEFTVRHLGLAKVRGRFNDFDAEVEIGKTLADTSVRADVALASVDTNNPDRDDHLRSSDFFSVDEAPRMTFESTRVERHGDGHRMVGDLTLNGVTREVAFDVEFLGTEHYPLDETTRAGFSGRGTLSRSDFGVTFDVPLGGDKVAIGDRIAIELEIQLIAAGR